MVTRAKSAACEELHNCLTGKDERRKVRRIVKQMDWKAPDITK